MHPPRAALDGLVRVYPAADGPLRGSALLWAHGGGFMHGDLDMPEADAVSRAFAERGAAVASVDYRRVVDGRNRFPAGSDDVLTAWRWLVANAAELGADPARLFAGGASAGANLVVGAVLRMLGHAPATASAPPPTGLFLAYPTLLAVQPAPDAALRAALDADPDADHFPPAVVHGMYENYLGRDPGNAPISAIPGLAASADLTGFPPTVMVNDEVDELRVSGEHFARTLKDAGVDVDVSIEPGTTHGHLNRPDEPAFAPTITRVAAWMSRH
ncbi:alpha/beta hydrolase fold domain-containing protein [Microbacterium sp. ARD32]|uniref:alpha/beta hydrolase n=1 Tax=Microbacterium sp. ARD32 TaxID=2962577 RepID=UPI00288161BD|nr:alpha/beta hydrolase fold domain-containing protein [Microbacterium sp. ARD32]MDT0156189.1 alpha/beta hydrolase fold domain-containing protein [Microbacterium sp. ARD32]